METKQEKNMYYTTESLRKKTANLRGWLKMRIRDIQDEGCRIIIDNKDYFKQPNAFEILRRHFLKYKELRISDQHCKNTIWGDTSMNVMFRAWHDYIHYKYGYAFDLRGETDTCIAQCRELPDDWEFEKLLLNIEIIEQANHFFATGEFPKHQIAFTLEKLNPVRRRDLIYSALLDGDKRLSPFSH